MGNRASYMLLDEEINSISEETGFSAAQIETLYSRFKSLDSSNSGSLSRQDFLRVPELAINPLCSRIVHMFFVDCDEDHDSINFRQFLRVLATFRSSHEPQSPSRNISRQQSFNSQHQAPLLFDTIDPSPFSSALTRHSRHPSFYEHNNGVTKKPVQLPLVDLDEPANSRKNKLYFMFKVYDVNNDDLLNRDDLVSILKMMVGTYVDDATILRIADRSLHEADTNCDGFIDFEEFCSAFTRKDIDPKMF